MFQTKAAEKIKTQMLSWVTFYFKSCRFRYMWKNIMEPSSPQTKTSTCALHAG